MAHGDHEEDEELPSALPGTVINGKYRIDGLIGRGGMGSVWSAMHLGLNQRVAVKLIARKYASSREARQRFDVEAKAVAQLRSRFVVQVYDNGETPEGTPFLVMEMLEGESLDARIQSRGTLTLDETLRFISHVARALTRAHSLGIVHRDLKPENIFITRTDDDDGEIAKVLDFGIAKIKTASGSDSATRTGAVLGTPLFMSPEQARALKSVDHRTDIYSLGMVTFMMLTGQPAFSGESFGDILVAICTQPLPDIRQLSPWLPAGVSPWLERACAREPEARFASIDEMLAAFYAAAGRERPTARKHEAHQENRSSADPPAKTAISSGVAQDRAAANSQSPGPPTMSAVAVTGVGLPTRSLVVPALLGGVALLIVGAGLIAALLSHKSTGAPASPAAVAVEAAASPQPSASALPAAVPRASEPTSASSRATPTASAPPLERPASAPQKPAVTGNTSGKVGPASDAKPTAKPVDVKPAPVRPKASPDLGF
jgi:serine/threonine protein kinase